MFSSWLAQADSLSAARALYMGAAYGDAFLEVRLLSYAQAIEAFQRRAYQGGDLYMDPLTYERDVLPTLTAAIPPISRSHTRPRSAAACGLAMNTPFASGSK